MQCFKLFDANTESAAGCVTCIMARVCIPKMVRQFEAGIDSKPRHFQLWSWKSWVISEIIEVPVCSPLCANHESASFEMVRQGDAAFLLATDVAARGLDILGVEAVVNFDAPGSLSSYMHRIGRTARAGAAGRAVTFAEDADRPLLKEVGSILNL